MTAWRRAGWLLLGLSLLLVPAGASLAEEGEAQALRVERHAGSDRVTTAAEVARTFDHSVPSVYIVSADRFADAMAAGPAAAVVGSPILLTGPKELPPATVDELVRLAPHHIFVVGGPVAISEAVVDQLRLYTSGSVLRISGPSRYDTAAAVSHAHFGPDFGRPVYVASGTDWPDALAAGSTAAAHRGPVLLVEPDWLPGPTRQELSRLRPTRIVVAGGPASVSPAIREELSWYTSGAVQWFHGPTRFETAARLSQSAFPRGTETVFIATGENYPDVLTGVPAAARYDAPILLLPRAGIPDAVAAELERLSPSQMVILGGHNAVSSAQQRDLMALLAEDG